MNEFNLQNKDSIAKSLAFEFISRHQIDDHPEHLAQSYSNVYKIIYDNLDL